MPTPPRSLILLTGLSGAGKSTALKILEDQGFFCVDNLPFDFLENYLQKEGKRKRPKARIAIDMDARDPDFLKKGKKVLTRLKKKSASLKILFLSASEEVLLRRYSQTRRRHPLRHHLSLLKAIRQERRRMEHMSASADVVIDTSHMTSQTLKRTLENLIEGRRRAINLPLSLISFGYRYGLPPQSDLIFDVRFLPNPYFVPSLKALDGMNRKVQNFVIRRRQTREFLRKAKDLLDFLIPHYSQEGKSYLTIALGCTGGRHRSVVLANHLKDYFVRQGLWVNLEHRDLHKEAT